MVFIRVADMPSRLRSTLDGARQKNQNGEKLDLNLEWGHEYLRARHVTE
jgi:hypothetical protein